MDKFKKLFQSRKFKKLILAALVLYMALYIVLFLQLYTTFMEFIKSNKSANTHISITDEIPEYHSQNKQFVLDSGKEALILTALENPIADEELLEAIDGSEKTREDANLRKALNDAEMEILCRITEAEAGGEDEYARTLVANVILNRVDSEIFPDSIEGVVFDKKHCVQFSPTVNGRYHSVSISNGTRDAVNKALEQDYSDGALYFRTTKGSEGKWHERSLTKLFSYSGITFYK